MQNTTSKSLRSRILLAACVVLLAFAFAACGSSSKSSGSSSTTTASATADITIQNLTFRSTPVQTGSTVTVKNEDSVAHTVTSDDGTSFNITINPGTTATFTAPGTAKTYKFHCNIHSSMHGTLLVQ